MELEFQLAGDRFFESLICLCPDFSDCRVDAGSDLHSRSTVCLRVPPCVCTSSLLENFHHRDRVQPEATQPSAHRVCSATGFGGVGGRFVFSESLVAAPAADRVKRKTPPPPGRDHNDRAPQDGGESHFVTPLVIPIGHPVSTLVPSQPPVRWLVRRRTGTRML